MATAKREYTTVEKVIEVPVSKIVLSLTDEEAKFIRGMLATVGNYADYPVWVGIKVALKDVGITFDKRTLFNGAIQVRD